MRSRSSRSAPPRRTASLRARERTLLLALTSIPTASGREWAVQRALDAWIGARGGTLRAQRDRVGNLLVTTARSPKPRLLITAHLDHPAFVVRRVMGPARGASRRAGAGAGTRTGADVEVELEFRGGVHDPYFERAAIEIFDDAGRPHRARVRALDAKAVPFKLVRAVLPRGAASIRRGAIGRWALPAPEIRDGLLQTHACDDLAAAATALIAYGRLLDEGAADGTGLLFTVAEEVGFLGAIRAALGRMIPRGAKLLCLENSRSFPHDSPIGAGAILRVGDRLSVFSPSLTNALTALYQRHAAEDRDFRWQRKLMPGGACEATAFAALGFESTCLCLPLGNYHNMREIDAVLAGRRPARVGREFVSIADVESLVRMLILAAHEIGAPTRRGAAPTLGDLRPRMMALHRSKARAVFASP